MSEEENHHGELLTLIQEQKEQLDILYSISDAIWSRRADNGKLLYANNAYYRLFDFTDEDIVEDKNMSPERIHPDDWTLFEQRTQSVRYSGYEELVYRYFHKDGSVRTLRTHGRLRKGAGNRPDMIYGVTVDITRETQLMQAIRNSEQRLRITINNTRDMIWSVDKDLRIIFCNEAFKDFFYKIGGVRLGEGDYVFGEWRSPIFVSRRTNDYERSLRGESFITIIEEHYQGQTLYFEISSCPITNHDGSIIGVNCISRDITDQEMQLMKIQRQNERLKEIAWIQSHKVRGPVASILGLVHLFEEDCNENNQEIIQNLCIAAHDLDNVIKEIVQSAVHA